MRWREAAIPVPMARVAVVAPRDALRDALARVADAGVVEFQRTGEAPPGPPADPGVVPRLAPGTPDLDALARAGRTDLLAGEAELSGYAVEAIGPGDVAGLVGWAPAAELPALSARLAEVGAAAVPLARPRGVMPPTALRRRAGRAFAPLVDTYATVPYADVDPTVLAGLAYVVMFGAMFGDVGHGALVLLGGLLVRADRPRRLARLRPRWPLIAGAGVASMLFGLAYGECFGPTGLVPTLGLSPLARPVPLLIAGWGWARCCWPVRTPWAPSTGIWKAVGGWLCTPRYGRRCWPVPAPKQIARWPRRPPPRPVPLPLPAPEPSRAEQIIVTAGQDGTADAARALVGVVAAARRRARGTALRARREAYEELRRQVRTAAAGLRAEPDYPQVLQRLAAAARRALGSDLATVSEHPDGGVTGQADGRRVDYSFPSLADRAVEALGAEVTAP